MVKKMILNDENLIAPCGLYCGECEAFQDGRCKGCLSRIGLCLKYSKLCGIYDCCINKKKLRFCNECENFPCNNFNFFMNEEYDWVFELKKNLEIIKSIGIKKFLKKEIERVEELIKCAKEKGIKHCSFCKDWPCEKMKRPPLTPA
jgi:hypothetical protein